MKKNWMYLLQSLILFSGTLFAWTNVSIDFHRFYQLYHSFTRIQNCQIPNPLTTPCFYGATAFLIACIWSFFIFRQHNIQQQKNLQIFLIAATLFAWGNFFYGVYRYTMIIHGPKISCSGVPTNNPLMTPCFFGSLIFLCAVCISLVITQKIKSSH